MKSLVILLMMVGFGQSSFNQFISMIDCTCSRYSAEYLGYGCWCGPGGEGTALDATDRCCQAHDRCWDALKVGVCRGEGTYWEAYTVTKSNCGSRYPYIYCDDSSNNACERALCVCDRTAALCLQRNEHTFNDRYRFYDNDRC
ncbi:basic phospholipase A2 vipoxin B chain-like [Apostichopus japonicus]|uniref:basic phospholipase A2 vipoxin B chain-like n=1 Tax=Stichopus japonicus TaxID=307972 RepID=UPI003AB75D22